MKPRLFINFRREDTGPVAFRLADDLARAVDSDQIFIDREGIKYGERWPKRLGDELKTCTVFFSLIGKNWHLIQNKETGQRRLDEADDWVRQEIETALKRSKRNEITLVTIFVDQKSPSDKVYPISIRGLHEYQGPELRTEPPDWENDVRRLVELLQKNQFRPAQRRTVRNPAKPTRPSAKPTVPADYCAWLQAQCGEIELLGLRVKQGQAVRLNSVYVPLTTPGGAETKSREKSIGPRTLIEREKPQLLLDLLDKESLYVPGPPGAGKSTFCHWVAWLAATGAMPPHEVDPPHGYIETFPSSFRNRLPVLIKLRDFWKHLGASRGGLKLSCAQLENALTQWLNDTRPVGLDWGNLKAHLKRGSALVIFDGVDEVPLADPENSKSSPRAMLLSGIPDAFQQWHKDNRYLVTSRPYGISDTDVARLGIRRAAIDDLANPVQGFLVRRWFQILRDSPAMADEMIDHVRAREGLDSLAANPLLLTAMCIIYNEGKRLPQDKYDLYARIVENVLYSRYPQDPALIDQVRNRLSVVAYGMHTGAGLGEERITPQAVATLGEVDTMLQAYLDRQSWTEAGFRDRVEAREDLLSRTGLLLPHDEKQASFYHFSLQEFLTAELLLDWDSDRLMDVFVKRAVVAEWHNTLSFVFGAQLAKSTSPERSIRLIESLIAAITDGALGLQVVVADCLQILLGRGINLRKEQAERFRQICLSAIQRQVPIRERNLLGLSLGLIGDPRIVEDLRDPKGYAQVEPGSYVLGEKIAAFMVRKPFGISRYPVTNSQYAMFLKDGGYDKVEFWSKGGLAWLRGQNAREPAWWKSSKWNGPNQPVVGVCFWEAEAFCKWAGGRLPTEREWEAAARGPEGHEYPWGKDWRDGICNTFEAGLRGTSSVGLFPNSRSKAYGLEDMAGNVWEWCADFYNQEKHFRVLRGGCWIDLRDHARASYRNRYNPYYRNDSVGFRVVSSSPIS